MRALWTIILGTFMDSGRSLARKSTVLLTFRPLTRSKYQFSLTVYQSFL